MITAYVDGTFLPLAEARVSPMDRGFLFGDGAYEVIPVYSRRAFRLDEHVARLGNTLAAMRLANPHGADEWKAIILEMLKRPEGATLKDIISATAWQAHSVRGFISGGLGKKMGITVESFKSETGERAYRIAGK